MQKFNNLTKLLYSDTQAKTFFDSLPNHIKEQVQTRSNNINSFSSLKDYAENLLRGDD